MRILQVGKYYFPEPGGIEDHLRGLCRFLLGKVDLRVIVSNTGRRNLSEDVEGVPVIRAGRLLEAFSTPLCPSLPYLVRRWRADIIHLHLPNPMGHAALLGMPRGTRLILTWHSDIVKQKFLLRAYEPILKSLLRRADLVITTSPNYLEYSSYLRAVREKCQVVPLGVDPGRFAKESVSSTCVSAIRSRFGSRIVLFVGRLIYYKGVTHLIEAMQFVKAQLLLVGTGRDEAELRQQVNRLGLASRVQFLGAVPADQLPAYYRSCDAFVLPSVAPSEAFGIVQLEAMASAKPVVSTDLPTGVPWVNKNGETGIVVPTGDPVALARALNSLFSDPGRAAEMGRCGESRVRSEFTVERTGAATLELYRSLLGR